MDILTFAHSIFWWFHCLNTKEESGNLVSNVILKMTQQWATLTQRGIISETYDYH